MQDNAKPLVNNRIVLLDVARGVALVAMAIFHFAFDLEMFGVVEPGYTLQPQWKYFARGIASSFLFLVGFALFLAHVNGIRWRSWLIRFAKIAGAALLVTLGTWIAIPDQFIFFGILHSIAFASILALAFVTLPWWLNLVAAFVVFTLRGWARTDVLDAPVWWWSGLSKFSPQAVDYVPVFPWFAPVLLGLAAAQLSRQFNLLENLASFRFIGQPYKLLRFFGHHGLIFYLVHQPVMVGLLYAVLFFTGYT